jgi:hypothetical protein
MKIENLVATGITCAGLFANLGLSSTPPNGTPITTRVVITALSSTTLGRPASLDAGDVAMLQGKTPVPILHLQRLAGNLSDMQLFVFLDDSTRSASLGTHLPELKSFLKSLPSTTQVAIGYMRNGTFALAQPFTTDHEIAAASVRLPESLPGANGSPYFALSDLARHWPSKQPSNRRAVLMLTDGVDRYFNSADMDDPYVDAAVRDALKAHVMVYSIYLRGAGRYGHGDWVTNFAQSRLNKVSQETGGNAYFETFSDPVAIAPFLKDLQERFDNQYQMIFAALPQKGVQPVKLRMESPELKVQGPTRIYIQ